MGNAHKKIVLAEEEIEFALTEARVNQELEGGYIPPEIQEMGRKVLRGEMTGDQMRQAIINAIR
ncbi:MAG: antitoxin VbhA family protein [Opitutaceae bacterium]|jgi:hypothetical protein|nr:antitoxin VbhA family protein [Opitutaceae bacterium]